MLGPLEMAEGRGPLGNRHPAPRLLRPWFWFVSPNALCSIKNTHDPCSHIAHTITYTHAQKISRPTDILKHTSTNQHTLTHSPTNPQPTRWLRDPINTPTSYPAVSNMHSLLCSKCSLNADAVKQQPELKRAETRGSRPWSPLSTNASFLHAGCARHFVYTAYQ